MLPNTVNIKYKLFNKSINEYYKALNRCFNIQPVLVISFSNYFNIPTGKTIPSSG